MAIRNRDHLYFAGGEKRHPGLIQRITPLVPGWYVDDPLGDADKQWSLQLVLRAMST
jgi:hypothetical protein